MTGDKREREAEEKERQEGETRRRQKRLKGERMGSIVRVIYYQGSTVSRGIYREMYR